MRVVSLVVAIALLAAAAWGYWVQKPLTDYGEIAREQRLLRPIATNRDVQSISTNQAYVSAGGTRALIAGGSLFESADGGVRWRQVPTVGDD